MRPGKHLIQDSGGETWEATHTGVHTWKSAQEVKSGKPLIQEVRLWKPLIEKVRPWKPFLVTRSNRLGKLETDSAGGETKPSKHNI
jgi:hypothetical protein